MFLYGFTVHPGFKSQSFGPAYNNFGFRVSKQFDFEFEIEIVVDTMYCVGRNNILPVDPEKEFRVDFS